MGRFVPIEVEAYSGHRADEAPRAFLLEGRRFIIDEIVDRWYQAGRDPTLPFASYFRVRTTEGSFFLIRQDHESQEWSIQVKDTSS